MQEFLEQGIVLLGGVSMLLGICFVYKNTAFSLAYARIAGNRRSSQRDNAIALRRLWAKAPEVMIGSNLYE